MDELEQHYTSFEQVLQWPDTGELLLCWRSLLKSAMVLFEDYTTRLLNAAVSEKEQVLLGNVRDSLLLCIDRGDLAEDSINNANVAELLLFYQAKWNRDDLSPEFVLLSLSNDVFRPLISCYGLLCFLRQDSSIPQQSQPLYDAFIALAHRLIQGCESIQAYVEQNEG